MADDNHDDPSRSWHRGERDMQRLAGADEALKGLAPKIYRDHLSQAQSLLVNRLTYVVVASVDPVGRVWTTLLEGAPGFIAPRGPFQIAVHSAFDTLDPSVIGFADGQAVGMLCIDMRHRRRLRVNGPVIGRSSNGFTIGVEQVYGNCPKYIRTREVVPTDGQQPTETATVEDLPGLDSAARALIRDADTFFVGSYVDRSASTRQVDASHRGGTAGFVHVQDSGALVIPEFPGNSFYNTLGNFLINPRAGLLFIDFERGDTLQVSGTVKLGAAMPAGLQFASAERLWEVAPDQVIRRRGALEQRWAPDRLEVCPDAMEMGNWRSVRESSV